MAGTPRPGPKTITLMWRAKTPRGWRFFPAILERKHGTVQARHGWVNDGGTLTEYTQGTYHLRSYVNAGGTGRKVYQPLATCNPRDAVLGLERARRAALAQGQVRSTLHLLKTAIPAYIKDCQRRGALEAAAQAKLTLDEFVRVCPVPHVRGIDRNRVLDFHAALRKRGMSERTIHNRHERLRAFLRFCKVDVSAVMPPAPKYEEGLPDIYTPVELSAILSAADEYMGVVIRMALQLGLREQELMYSEWADVDFHHAAFRVQGKPGRGFAVKDSEQREIPIPADLVDRLEQWRKGRAGSLILGTAGDEPNGHLLRALKRLAKRAGLPGEWYLHKFRATYLTTLLRQGVDARTVQSFAGHSDLNTTLRYLKPASASQMQNTINAVKWTD